MKGMLFPLPPEIPATKAVGDLTDEEWQRLFGLFVGARRWGGLSEAERKRTGRKMSRARMTNLTAEERSAIARKAGRASARRAKERAKRAGQRPH
jgi:hypothetical protein